MFFLTKIVITSPQKMSTFLVKVGLLWLKRAYFIFFRHKKLIFSPCVLEGNLCFFLKFQLTLHTTAVRTITHATNRPITDGLQAPLRTDCRRHYGRPYIIYYYHCGRPANPNVYTTPSWSTYSFSGLRYVISGWWRCRRYLRISNWLSTSLLAF